MPGGGIMPGRGGGMPGGGMPGGIPGGGMPGGGIPGGTVRRASQGAYGVSNHHTGRRRELRCESMLGNHCLWAFLCCTNAPA